MSHRADFGEVEFADELRAEGRRARRVESVQATEMMLDEFGARLHAEVGHVVIVGVDAVGADGNDDVAVAR